MSNMRGKEAAERREQIEKGRDNRYVAIDRQKGHSGYEASWASRKKIRGQKSKVIKRRKPTKHLEIWLDQSPG